LRQGLALLPRLAHNLFLPAARFTPSGHHGSTAAVMAANIPSDIDDNRSSKKSEIGACKKARLLYNLGFAGNDKIIAPIKRTIIWKRKTKRQW
jgi:hypothetical protein